MDSGSSEPKKYPPTEKKLRDLERKGQFPKTEFAESTLEIIAFTCIIIIAMDYLFDNSSAWFTSMVNAMVQEDFVISSSIITWGIVSVMLFKLVITIFNWIIFNKSVVSTEDMGFKIEKINPANGLKNIFGLEQLSRSLRKILALLFLLFLMKYVFDVAFRDELARLNSINNVDYLLYSLRSYILLSSLVFVVYGVGAGLGDFMLERFYFHHKNRMTFTEMKNEIKETEGSPEIKSKRRGLMREVMDLPVTKGRQPTFALANPTHILVPICYNPDIDSVPVVLRIYTDLLAQEERKILQAMDVPIIENKELARAFYKKMDTGENYIPPVFYRDVALIISVLKRSRHEKNIRGND